MNLLGHRQAVRNVNFNNCGDMFVLAGYDCYLKLLDTETDDVVSRFSLTRITTSMSTFD